MCLLLFDIAMTGHDSHDNLLGVLFGAVSLLADVFQMDPVNGQQRKSFINKIKKAQDSYGTARFKPTRGYRSLWPRNRMSLIKETSRFDKIDA